MPFSSIGDGGSVRNGGDPLPMWGLQQVLILPYLERLFVGLHFFSLADSLLRVRIIYYACGCFIARADTDMS